MPMIIPTAALRSTLLRSATFRIVPLSARVMPCAWTKVNSISQTKSLHNSARLWSKKVAVSEGSNIQEQADPEHDLEETFEEFTARFEKEFEAAYDLFEVQRVLNNCFSYDLVPAPAVLEKALRAARRVNDLPTAIRVFEALKFKVDNEQQYKAYLDELADIRKELGVPLKEDLFPNGEPETVLAKQP
ncbi:hypothetical protein TBLA_0C03120 [Henningerozyma blattae CBS 6284]|uniref:Cytochrome c oxidase subunit 6, mitochondrial n=1 Tax=Henningerozyma blattae (strain ATCC 34711 / CBS 6284 / DSM 70876 / NBRC 10599 / NRRL Y-10934 / UCD 77-7) TaxID=1071380 RepID=I2H164_HENB6|nr:hypothetical protein TBLA_0C03120 [Tetrapisispora blattae CBS 6284]CCH60116.1 hypothetical protein TBLA_0C03120 [Tetrapisispora blattae CBS 6284]